MTFIAVEPFARAAVVAHKNVGLLFLISGINSHDEI
jgi:hypothetical protein